MTPSPEFALQTPVVMIVFNRPENTRRVFEAVAAAKPTRLLLIADGARSHKSGEEDICRQVREIVTRVDWPCEVLTNFADQNMGCRNRIVSGLDWVFSQVEEAIILEDDCLPDPTFFRYCAEMLEHYRNDPRVSLIAGTSWVTSRCNPDYSYYFSEVTHIWGWASWRRMWKMYDEHMKTWPEVKRAGLMNEAYTEPKFARYWSGIFDRMYSGTGPNTWDYQVAYMNVTQHLLMVVPTVNLVTNIGYEGEATHTLVYDEAMVVPRTPMAFPLRHPPAMVPMRSLDDLDQELHFVYRLPRRVKRKIHRVRARFGL